MNLWILIIILTNPTSAVAIQEFGSERACNTAAYAVKQVEPGSHVICTPYFEITK